MKAYLKEKSEGLPLSISPWDARAKSPECPIQQSIVPGLYEHLVMGSEPLLALSCWLDHQLPAVKGQKLSPNMDLTLPC